MTGRGGAALFTPTEVIGHRGNGRGPGENTAESFAAAVENGAAWVEVDVRRSADDVLVVHHDAALDDGRVIVDLPAAECAKAGLLTLDAALDAIPAGTGVDFDVKTVMEDAAAPAARRTTTLLLPYLRAERRRPVFVCSFDPAALLAVHAEAPGVPTAWMPFVRNPLDQAVAGAAGMGCAAVAIDARSFGLAGDAPVRGRRETEYAVGVAHSAGLEVVCWCPDAENAARFAAAGVDAVVVDDVPGVVAALKQG
ncbi:glycerophosphoryl diester phosphodiesterase [Murinocardiopsis flavida]|uniref:Glycerophosphoryl diester phosphodiesterase n=1 Tax=Murinocardiopsis flavida TaxID=645275 RepID=A0A2P8DIK7_9ACTN|nr:glycerophosphodiester phosphodiesterase [Murinocardiopsis flavida]PSK97057.1 glycerophosphoryl diester phosphodiesterase [Murinocardiopsis flavida]